MKMANLTYLEKVIRDQPYGWEYIEEPSAPFHFSWEEIDHDFWHGLVSSNWKLAIHLGVGYILVISGLQSWMKDKPAFDLRGPLFWWNLSLGVFSILGFSRTLPGFMYVTGRKGGLYTSICLKKGADVPFGFWGLTFIFSKFWELGDTVFIVLRKRPLIFLQWYHHLVTMSVTWILSPLAEPVMRWYALLNFGVHSLMYPYFAAKAAGLRLSVWVANLITTLQLAQMLIGFAVNMASMYYRMSGHDCVRYNESIQLGVFVYGSFIILFGKLFYDSIIKRGRMQKDILENKID